MNYDMMRNAFADEEYEDNYDYYCWEDDVYEEIDTEWPNRGRFGNLPSLSFLKANYHPPMTKPEPLHGWMYENHSKFQEECKAIETEKEKLQVKADKVLKELKEAEEVPKTYGAAKWGATSARDALVKRLTKDLDDALDLVQTQKQKMNELVKKNETLTNLLSIQKSIEDHYTKHIEERNKFWEDVYGKQKPLTDLKQVEWEYEGDLVEETDKYVWYHFGPQANMNSCLRALAIAGYEVRWTDERDFEVSKK